ncbi:hypothetical protein NE237_004173 [Protea cynaroides]|uniref:SCP domain-containing protein n=1 Tax=Protea cynaroides TaxID=273540 RepID=A0A9Q0KIE5_9MAGN|nr:hypothetical protein NE237_004173 [Protea cynaroides]
MGSYKLHLVLLCLIALAFFHFSQTQKEEYLAVHNAVRSEVGVGSITWNGTVAAYARDYTNQRAGDCNLVHSSRTYVENLAWSSVHVSSLSQNSSEAYLAAHNAVRFKVGVGSMIWDNTVAIYA